MRDDAKFKVAWAVVTALCVAIVAVLSGCAPASPAVKPASDPTEPAELSVSAATTLRKAFEELAPEYEKANGVTLVFNFAASGVLQKQIEGGAPVDVFVSASPAQVDTLTAQGFISAEDTSTFISNELIIAVPQGNPAGINGPDDLSRAGRLATGNPGSTPVGAKAQEWLTDLGMWDRIESKFVYGENAAQVTDYVARGEVDAALMFASEAAGRDDIGVVYIVPASQIKPIKYVAAPLKASANRAAATEFVAFLSTPEAQQILIANGFVACEPD